MGGCTKRMPPNSCRANCLHRALVEEYRDAKILSDEQRKVQRENETGGFPAEAEEWDRSHPTWAFRDFLIQRKGSRVVDMNTPTDRTEEYDFIVRHIAPNWTTEKFQSMATPERNAILDELRRREETMEARAEERRRGDWAIPAHIRRDFQ